MSEIITKKPTGNQRGNDQRKDGGLDRRTKVGRNMTKKKKSKSP